MTYRCGIGPGIAALGVEPGPPRITCNLCARVLEVREVRGGAPAWLRNGTAPKGWRLVYEDGHRIDLCPRCVEDGARRRALHDARARTTLSNGTESGDSKR